MTEYTESQAQQRETDLDMAEEIMGWWNHQSESQAYNEYRDSGLSINKLRELCKEIFKDTEEVGAMCNFFMSREKFRNSLNSHKVSDSELDLGL